MKEMEYSIERKIEVLDTGYCFGLLYYIMNLGTHPTAYIRIPEEHKNYKKDYDDIYLQVHGGLTYARNYLWISENQKIEGWFVGWDYGHCGDYAGYEEMFPTELRTGGKKWTTEEIFKEVKEACYQLAGKELIILSKANNKIRIIDLLNKIAKGEEVPNLKIKHWKQIYNFNIKMGFITCQSDEGYNLDLIQCLNDEVEILEDNTEEIEELKRTENVYDMTLECYHDIEKKISNDELADKINEIIRYIKRKDKSND